MPILPRPRAAFLALCLAIPAGIHAQEDVQVGGVLVHLQKDRGDVSFAVLRASADSLAGAIVWACGGDVAGLSVGVVVADTSTGFDSSVPTVWRFDQDPPRRVALWNRSRPWLLLPSAADGNALMERARRGGTLLVEVPAAPPSRGAAEYRYDLAGVDESLGRLECATGAGGERNRAGMRTLARMVVTAETPGVGVTEDMQLINVGDVRRLLSQYYPPVQRDSGVSGEVEVRFRVMENGAVDAASLQVVRSTDPAFGAAALVIARQMRFLPARVNGRPVKAWASLPFRFQPPD
jgi:TonB family protein